MTGPGHFGGPPRDGKTALAADLARVASQAAKDALFVSLEVTEKEIGQGLVAAGRKVGLTHQRQLAQTDSDSQRIGRTSTS
ncbi:hypothetical protein GCM10023317_33780 [Actinopolymorpha pittospori]|nr:DnaB-like helicase C-terminal domain-containing protein [Actinopolymorpha pittospori]